MFKKKTPAEKLAATQVWFDGICAAQLPVWNAKIAPGTKKHYSRREMARRQEARELLVLEEAKAELARFDAELVAMLTRTGIILTAASLLIAGFALGLDKLAPQTALAMGRIIWALKLTLAAFVVSVAPLAPQIIKALGPKYTKRAIWTVVTASSRFALWVKYCTLSDRRAGPITWYKRSHAVAIPLLLAALVLIYLGIEPGTMV